MNIKHLITTSGITIRKYMLIEMALGTALLKKESPKKWPLRQSFQ